MGFGTADYNVVDQIFVNAPLQLGVGDPAVPFDFITVTIPIPFASGSYFGHADSTRQSPMVRTIEM